MLNQSHTVRPMTRQLQRHLAPAQLQNGCALYIYEQTEHHDVHHRALLEMGLSVCAVDGWGALEDVLEASGRLGLAFDVIVADLPPDRAFFSELYPELEGIPLVSLEK